MKAIIITRDRVTYTHRCAEALQQAGLDVHIVDHHSTWPDMRTWLNTSGYPVHHAPNRHPRSLWTWISTIVDPDEPYVVTDPDVIPDPACPADWPMRLLHVLDEQPWAVKAGLGLRIDNLPDDLYPHAQRVRDWEAQHWAEPAGDNIYRASIDTTLAIYRPLAQQPHFALGPAVRTGHPYVAQHLPWYGPPMSGELLHYQEHAIPGVSCWNNPDLYFGGGQ